MSRPRRRLPSRAPGPLTGDSRFSKGDTVEIVYTPQTGTVERIEGPDPITGLTYVHVRIEVCPWLLVQPSMALHRAKQGERR